MLNVVFVNAYGNQNRLATRTRNVMRMDTISVSVPDEFEEMVSIMEGELEDQVRLMAALKMFELGTLSSGHAAQLAGRARKIFECMRSVSSERF